MDATRVVMTTDVVTVTKQTPVSRAIDILVENNVTGLPVLDDDGALIGVVTEKDMMGQLFAFEDDSGKVEDFMTKDIVSFEVDEDIITICECLVNNNFRRVPIVSDGKLVGIISRRDLIKYILEPIG